MKFFSASAVENICHSDNRASIRINRKFINLLYNAMIKILFSQSGRAGLNIPFAEE